VSDAGHVACIFSVFVCAMTAVVDPTKADAIRATAINPRNKRFMSHLLPLTT
jgi:hypothetical protein